MMHVRTLVIDHRERFGGSIRGCPRGEKSAATDRISSFSNFSGRPSAELACFGHCSGEDGFGLGKHHDDSTRAPLLKLLIPLNAPFGKLDFEPE